MELFSGLTTHQNGLFNVKLVVASMSKVVVRYKRIKHPCHALSIVLTTKYLKTGVMELFAGNMGLHLLSTIRCSVTKITNALFAVMKMRLKAEDLLLTIAMTAERFVAYYAANVIVALACFTTTKNFLKTQSLT